MRSIIRILHVVPELGYGGVEKIVRSYYEHMDHAKFVFDFVTHGKIEDYHQQMINQGSKIYYFKTVGTIGITGYKKQIKAQIDLQKYDAIHIHVGHVVGVYAFLYKCCGAKIIISHAHVSACLNSKQKYLMPLFRIMTMLFSDKLIACGKDAGKFCFGKAKYTILPNGLNYNAYKSITRDDIDRLKAEFGVNDDTLLVGHVGRFSKQKNHSFLAEVIHSFVVENKNVKFILVGDGPDRETIEQTIKANGDGEYVVFAGVRNDVAALMKMFDVFVLPSLFEGLPIVGIEAQAAGTPCIFSDTIDKAVCICRDYCEFVPIDKGTDLWVDAIKEMRNYGRNNDSNIYSALCENGYEISKTALRLEEIYNALTSDV